MIGKQYEAKPIATLGKLNRLGSLEVNASATISHSNEVSFLQVFLISRQSGGNLLKTKVFFSTGINGFLHRSECAKKFTIISGHWCYAQHSRYTRDKRSDNRKYFSQIKSTTFKCNFSNSVCPPINLIGKPLLRYNKLRQNFNHLNVLPNKNFYLFETCHDPRSRGLWATTPIGLHYKNTMWAFLCSKKN